MFGKWNRDTEKEKKTEKIGVIFHWAVSALTRSVWGPFSPEGVSIYLTKFGTGLSRYDEI